MKFIRGCKKMKPKKKKRRNEAQTFMEYVLLLGVVAAIYVTMTPLLRRGIQSMVKSVADQIGNQVNADDGLTQDRRAIYSKTLARGVTAKTIDEWQGDITVSHDDAVQYQKDSKTLLLFTDFVNEEASY